MTGMSVKMKRYTVPWCLIVLAFLNLAEGLCTFPSYIRGTWISSEKNNLEFADQYFTGYTVHTFATNNFTCQESDGTKYVAKSESFSRFGLNFYAYLCLEFQEIKTDLYIYYKASDELAEANNERVIVRLASLSAPTFSQVCTVSSYTDVRYSVLMKSGSIEDVKSNCPIPLLGNFAYTFNSGSGDVCNTSSSSLTVCPAKNKMVFDYTKCSQIQGYSAGGELNCVYSTESNGVYTVHVYNLDATTDQSTTYRFTCYLSTGYENVYATQYPGDCPSAMNYTYAASPGAVLRLYASEVCAYDTDEALSAGVIAAIVIVCVLVVAIIIAMIVYYFYRKRQKKKREEWEAANRKVDPDELSPNMRLGLPDESRYDLDRLMYSPENNGGINNNNNKTPRRDISMEGLEGYNEAALYLNEDQRQTALEAQVYTDRRKRKDRKDEFSAALPTNKVFSSRIKDLASGRKKPFKMATLAKLKLKPKPRPMVDTPDGSQGGRATQTNDVTIHVDITPTPGLEHRRKTRFADELLAKDEKSGEKEKKSKPLEEIETLSDIADNELGVDDLSEEEKEPRLRLPNLKPPKKEKRKRQRKKEEKRKKVVVSRFIPFGNTPFIRKIVLFNPNPKSGKKRGVWQNPPKLRPRSRPWSKMVRRLANARRQNEVTPLLSMEQIVMRSKTNSSQANPQQIQGMPHNTRFMPPKSRINTAEPEFTEPMTLYRGKSSLTALTPLARIHKKDNPKAWREAVGGAEYENMDLMQLQKNLSENRWKKLLEELYRDKKYFDYIKQTSSKTETALFNSADNSLQYLYGRALFWEQQEPIPTRPPSHVKRMFSRYEHIKSPARSLQRSSTTMSKSGYKRATLPRTPSTQISKLAKREKMAKLEKDAANRILSPTKFFEGGTQTEFSPIPSCSPDLTPYVDTPDLFDKVSFPGSIKQNGVIEHPVAPAQTQLITNDSFNRPITRHSDLKLQKEVTRSDIKLEEVEQFDITDNDRNQMYLLDEELTVAI